MCVWVCVWEGMCIIKVRSKFWGWFVRVVRYVHAPGAGTEKVPPPVIFWFRSNKFPFYGLKSSFFLTIYCEKCMF
jgi:hypothetical protein